MKERVIRFFMVMLFISSCAVTRISAQNDDFETIDVVESEDLTQPPSEQTTSVKRLRRTSAERIKKQRDTDRCDRKLILGREYYYALIDKSSERHWAIPISVHFDTTDKFFDNNCQTVDLATGTFGGPIRLRDIYLFSRLSENALVQLDNGAQTGIKTRTPTVTNNIPFGNVAEDLFTTLLAPVELGFRGQQRGAEAIISGIYRFLFGCEDELEFVVGAQLPIRTRINDLQLEFVNGSLFRQGFQQDGIVRQTPLFDFFRLYSGLEDFLIREVLDKKGLVFQPHQVKTGVGDISIFGLFDFAGYFCHLDGLQLGVNVVLPTGSQATGNLLFEPELGNGAYSFEPFFNAIFNTPSPVFNPSLKLVGQFSLSRKPSARGSVRVPQTITNTTRGLVKDVPGLVAPDFYAQATHHFVSAFSELDSKFAAFANPVPGACVKRGSRFLVGVGNYMYNVFNLGFRLGLFYDFALKNRDKITVSCPPGTFDTCQATKFTETRSHSIGANLTYKFRNMLELNIGTQHVIAGRNIPRTHEFFASVIAIF